MMRAFYVYEPYRDRYLKNDRGVATWVREKSAGTRFLEDQAEALADRFGCLIAYACDVHPPYRVENLVEERKAHVG